MINLAPRENNVHEFWDKIKVPSSHGKDINYVVSYGLVDWDDNVETSRPAIFVMMEYGGNLHRQLVAHITTDKNSNGTTDFEEVMKAINTLKERHNL
ncbi:MULTISPECIES: hypothetical protein [Pontibacillus]|uniref:EF-hand domain-containing protein n=1 Tax=Pontibacillus chungwhensis TaxID=265426 RepID=A0ABY8UWB8_9BACI|nr:MULTISPECIES: hypothetical protein [Pontibacillus]MCD5324149.1 hypothetical protein [Pontibacillus sp. HN14]WIF97792.1 hypothetical protein QNI29_19020 [Pontibacillus chungwhensis]